MGFSTKPISNNITAVFVVFATYIAIQVLNTVSMTISRFLCLVKVEK